MRAATSATIRYWEKQFAKLTDKEILQTGLQPEGAGPAAANRSIACFPEVFGLVCVAAKRTVRVCGPSTCNWRPASSCTTAPSPSWPPAKARR